MTLPLNRFLPVTRFLLVNRFISRIPSLQDSVKLMMTAPVSKNARTDIANAMGTNVFSVEWDTRGRAAMIVLIQMVAQILITGGAMTVRRTAKSHISKKKTNLLAILECLLGNHVYRTPTAKKAWASNALIKCAQSLTVQVNHYSISRQRPLKVALPPLALSFQNRHRLLTNQINPLVLCLQPQLQMNHMDRLRLLTSQIKNLDAMFQP